MGMVAQPCIISQLDRENGISLIPVRTSEIYIERQIGLSCPMLARSISIPKQNLVFTYGTPTYSPLPAFCYGFSKNGIAPSGHRQPCQIDYRELPIRAIRSRLAQRNRAYISFQIFQYFSTTQFKCRYLNQSMSNNILSGEIIMDITFSAFFRMCLLEFSCVIMFCLLMLVQKCLFFRESQLFFSSQYDIFCIRKVRFVLISRSFGLSTSRISLGCDSVSNLQTMY